MMLEDGVAALRGTLTDAGLAHIGVGRVGDYNAAVPPAFALPELGDPHHALVCIGHGREVWRPFVRAMREDPRYIAAGDPFDRWTTERIVRALDVLPRSLPRDLRLVFEPPPRQVAMQAAAVACGLAARGPAGLVVDGVRGPWMAFRAVLVLALPAPAPRPVSSPCPGCVGTPCVPALGAAMAPASQAARAPSGDRIGHAATVQPAWRRWLDVRDACPIGRDWRYSDAQIRYHYARDPAALLEED